MQDHAKWGVTAAAPPDCCSLPAGGSPLGAAVCIADQNRWAARTELWPDRAVAWAKPSQNRKNWAVVAEASMRARLTHQGC